MQKPTTADLVARLRLRGQCPNRPMPQDNNAFALAADRLEELEAECERVQAILKAALRGEKDYREAIKE